MRQGFDSRPLLIRRRYTGTIQRTALLDWEVQVSHGMHLFCVIAASVVARNVANQGVLVAIGPGVLGQLYLAVAGATALFLALVGHWAKERDARRVARALHVGAALTMGAAFGLPRLLPAEGPYVAVGTYVAMDIVFALTLFGFGLSLGARFEPREARRVAARVGAGGIMGGLFAGAVLSLGAPALGSQALYLVAAVIALAPIFWLPVERHPRSTAILKASARDRPDVPALAPYGWAVALTTLLMVAVTTLVDYQFRYAAERWFNADRITAFFGLVVVISGCASIAFQITLLNRLLDRAGLFATAAVMPIALAVAGVAFWFSPFVVTLVVLKLVDSGANMSLQQATGALLLAPLGTRARSVWQSRIDGIAKRGGQALTGLFLLLYPWPPHRVMLVTLGLCGLWLVALVLTRRRYVQLLTEMVRSPPTEQPELRAYDGTTIHLLEEELKSASARRAAVILQLLSRAEHPAPRETLRELIDRDPGGLGTAAVLEHLVTLGDVPALARLSAHEDPRVSSPALVALADLDAVRAERRARELLASTGSAPLRALAAALIADTDKHALELCRTFAESADPQTRLAVAEGLGRASPGPDGSIAEVVARLAGDANLDVARSAFESMNNHPSASGCRAALDALGRGGLRANAMRSLAAFGSPVVGPVARTLEQRANDARAGGALTWVLGRVATTACVPPLIRALGAPNVEVRLAAVVGLSMVARRNREAPIPQEAIATRYVPELEYYGRARRAARSLTTDTPSHQLLRGLLRHRAQASLETVFRSFALHYPQDAIASAFLAINNTDRSKRQLALELLDTLLEAPVRNALAAALATAEPSQAVMRRDLETLATSTDPFLMNLTRHVQVDLGLVPKSKESHPMRDQLITQVLELQAVSIFGDTSAEDLADIAAYLTPKQYPKGAVIFSEGDAPDAFYLVREGRVSLTSKGKTVDNVGPGEAFGIVAVLDRMPRELTANATTEVHALSLSTEDVWQLLADRPSLMQSFFRALTSTIRGQVARSSLGKRRTTTLVSPG